MSSRVLVKLRPGGETINIVSNVCPTYTPVGSGSVSALKSISVQKTPLLLPPGAVIGQSFCFTNPIACCEPTVGCCPGVPPPYVVLLTISGSTCPNLNGITFPLVWDAYSQSWVGASMLGAAGTQPWIFVLRCGQDPLFAPAYALWVLNPGQDNGNAVASADTQGCNPFRLTGGMNSTLIVLPCTGTNPGQFNFGITALPDEDHGSWCCAGLAPPPGQRDVLYVTLNNTASCGCPNGTVIPIYYDPVGRCWDSGGIGGCTAWTLACTGPQNGGSGMNFVLLYGWDNVLHLPRNAFFPTAAACSPLSLTFPLTGWCIGSTTATATVTR